MKPKIGILSSSVRSDRKSHRLALYFSNYLRLHELADTDIIDLKEYNFPMFEERLRFHPNPTEGMKDFARRIVEADGLIIVTPEYNGGTPAALKNVIDLLFKEWEQKPVALAVASSGAFGASQVMQHLLFVLWKIGAWVVPTRFQAAKVQDAYGEDGTPTDAELSAKIAGPFFDKLLWAIRANNAMSEK